MDERLLRAWKEGHPPFHGCTLWAENLTFEQVVDCSQTILLVLEKRQAKENLRKFDDWHEHDGYIKEASPISLSEIEAAFASAAVLLQFCTDETDVCAAIYPQTAGLLWRIGFDGRSTDRNGKHGDTRQRWRFDFSMDRDGLVAVKALLSDVHNVAVNEEPTIAFFDRNSTEHKTKLQRKKSRNVRLPSQK
jgi:hypothetical protein